jgi:quercetin dioxygenase-like cupin family protein
VRAHAAIGLFAVTVALAAQTSAQRAAIPQPADQAEHRLEADDGRVRVYRVKLDPGDSIPVHTHAAGWLGVTIVGGLGPGSYRWYDAGAPNPLAAGTYPLEIIEVEPK